MRDAYEQRTLSISSKVYITTRNCGALFRYKTCPIQYVVGVKCVPIHNFLVWQVVTSLQPQLYKVILYYSRLKLMHPYNIQTAVTVLCAGHAYTNSHRAKKHREKQPFKLGKNSFRRFGLPPACLPPATVCVDWLGRKTLKQFPNSLVKMHTLRKWIQTNESAN